MPLENLNIPRLILNWDEIKEMSNNDIDFGSHTCSHSILTKIDLDSAKKEIINSKKLIEEKLGKPIEVFCYPRGEVNDFSQIHYKILKKVGNKISRF